MAPNRIEVSRFVCVSGHPDKIQHIPVVYGHDSMCGLPDLAQGTSRRVRMSILRCHDSYRLFLAFSSDLKLQDDTRICY